MIEIMSLCNVTSWNKAFMFYKTGSNYFRPAPEDIILVNFLYTIEKLAKLI